MLNISSSKSCSQQWTQSLQYEVFIIKQSVAKMGKLAWLLLATCTIALISSISYSALSLKPKSEKNLSLEEQIKATRESHSEKSKIIEDSKSTSRKSSITSLINDVAALCLHKLDLNFFKDLYDEIQFWQTWSHLQFVTLLNETKVTHLFTDQVKKQATKKAIQQWTNFDPNTTSNVPAYFKDFIFFQNTDYWDPKNKRILWDDKQWLGLSYLQLYRHYGQAYKNASKFLEVAEHLYQMIIAYNGNPISPVYIGLEWLYGGDYRNSVTNELFFALLGRLYINTNKTEYLTALYRQYRFLFLQPRKYINNNTLGLFPDAIGPDGFFTYNQGMALEGLAYLAVFDPLNGSEFITQFARMVNGFTSIFRRNKHICLELTVGSRDALRCGSVFRALLFRHIVRSKMIFDKYQPVLWNQLLALAPVLKIFILDNFQAMCKFTDLKVPYYWDESSGMVHYYNEFNQFYVLYSGHYLFGLEELVTEGVSMECAGVLSLTYSSNRVKSVKLTTVQVNSYKSAYIHNKTIPLISGLNILNNLLMQDFCAANNNRNILTLSISYQDGSEATYTFAHLQYTNAQFSLIPDKSGEQIVNNYGVRINSDCKNNKMTYESKKIPGSKIILSSQEPGCSKKSHIQLEIV